MDLATTNLVKIEFKFPAVEKNVNNIVNLGFIAFITDFDDTFAASWEEEEVYGRMDPLENYKSTKRTITCSFDIPAESGQEALTNMMCIKGIQRMLYPLYKRVNQEWIISSAPLCGIKIPTLMEEMSEMDDFLYGVLESFSLKPDMAQGCFDNLKGSTLGEMEDNNGFISVARQFSMNSLRVLPKLYRGSFTLKVLHKNPLGWMYGGSGEIRYRALGAKEGNGRQNNLVRKTLSNPR